ncbi:MAG TPA: heavy metal translocating P-type ATPase [Polyangiaceae bacterium]|nr:heavy metal translocating P-type ATPase [Polyangiaceae bacterium]
MNSELRILQKSGSRACIVGARGGSNEARELEAWLGQRVDVLGFEQRGGIGTFEVRYDDGVALPGRFLRSLRDKIRAMRQARLKPEPFGVEPVHELRGRVRLHLTGIREPELATLTMLIAGLPGVKHSEHLTGSRTMLVLFDPEVVTEERVLDALRRSDPVEWKREWHRPTPTRWLAAVGGTGVLFMCIVRAAPFPWLASGVTLSTLRPLARSIGALAEGKISIDLLDVAATFAALATGRPVTAAFVIWMVGVGDLLLDISANRARSALSTLMRQGEQRALRLLPNGELKAVPVRELNVADRFVVHTGSSIGADGTVVSGLAEVDEKALTGESRLRRKKRGDRVFASTVVAEGQIVVEVDRAGNDTEAAKVERILNTVGSKPLSLQREALELGSKLVLPTFGVAWLAAALSGDLTRAVCVLITDFGTGIRISVPISAMSAMALAAREGVLVKGAQYLEQLAAIDVIVFDKTGTLTNGAPEVVEVVTVPGVREKAFIRACASAEDKYDHPVARALKAYARLRGIRLVQPEPASEEYAVGLGLSARVEGRRVRLGRPVWMKSQNLEIPLSLQKQLARFARQSRSSLCVAFDDRVVGIVAYSDATRPESAALVRRLRADGRRRIVLLSGDSPAVVKNVARALGIDEAAGGLLPEQKAEYIRRLREDGNVVAMVGDGINDAPALASADVGVSIGGSTDVALETADVVLLDDGLSQFEKALLIGDRAMSSVRQNLGVVIWPNAIAIALGAAGLLTPPVSAVINNGATILAVLVGVIPLLRLKPHLNMESKSCSPL